MTPWISAGTAVAAVGVSLLAGVYAVLVLDRLVGDRVAGRPSGWRDAFVGPLREAALDLLQQRTTTERPDREGWALASALLASLAAVSLVVIPVALDTAVADVPAGLVLFGAATALVTIAVFLHGWSSNSVFPLIGTYRFVAVALSVEIPFFLVLIAAALPAESLAVGDVVLSQASLWNIVRQPLGLPIYLLGGLGVAFWGPLSSSDATDLAGGTMAEVSGSGRLLWQWGQAGILVAVAAMGAAAFLGGWLGPWLPGPVWLAVKTLALLVVLVGSGHVLARVRLERFVMFGWTILIPLALVHVFLSGILLL
jgi:NADH-quinone oxidoreductase subunit H